VCRHLQANTKYGKYDIWVDPGKGFVLRKAVVLKQRGDLGWLDRPLDYLPPAQADRPPMVRLECSFHSAKITRIGDAFLAQETAQSQTRIYGDGMRRILKEKTTYRDLETKPDFEGAKAFDLSFIPDGAIVFDAESPGFPLEWRHGKVQAKVDEEAAAIFTEGIGKTISSYKKGELSSLPVSESAIVGKTDGAAESNPSSRENRQDIGKARRNRTLAATGVGVVALVASVLLCVVLRRRNLL
jgi:hypothetical protein